eukprot:Skav204114  [mRNA]  locus=scaffold5190:116221:125462:- [translate_table: standard]
MVDRASEDRKKGERRYCDGSCCNVAGTPEKAFRELAHRTAEGFDFQMDILWSPDGEKKVTCHGSSCDFDDGWVPLDGVDQCDPGHVWSKALGCSASAVAPGGVAVGVQVAGG